MTHRFGFDQGIREQSSALDALRTETATAKQTAKAALADVQRARDTLAGNITIAEHEATTQLTQKINALERKIDSLRASRVIAELTWNDLPKKISIGGAAFAGLVVGAVLTIFTAASERRQINFQANVMRQQVVDMDASMAHWENTAGFKLGNYRGERVFILDDGQKFDDYTPVFGAIDAGNLWRIVQE